MSRLLAVLHNCITWPASWHYACSLAYAFTHAPLSRLFLPLYIRLYAVDLNEAALPLSDYPTIAALFQRDLKAGLRPFCRAKDAFCSPVDGIVVSQGVLQQGQLLQAKGESYSLADILANETAASYFGNGSFIVIYMPAGAYHKVHSPLRAHIVHADFIPGRHFALHRLSRLHTHRLYARNTRQITYLHYSGSTGDGQPATGVCALVQVASMLVGSIQNTFSVEEANRAERYLQRGELLGGFNFGSTIILLLPPGAVELDPDLLDRTIQVGQCIGKLNLSVGSGGS